MKLDFHRKLTTIFGLNDSGKSYLMKWLLDETQRDYVVFDPLSEYPDNPNSTVITTQNRRGDKAKEDLGDTIDLVIKPNQDTIDYFVVDEVNRYVQGRGDLDGPVGELVDLRKHYDIGVFMIARRPTQVHPDIRGLSDQIFIFHLPGKTDVNRLNDMAAGLGNRVNQLNMHEFLIYRSGKTSGPFKIVKGEIMELAA